MPTNKDAEGRVSLKDFATAIELAHRAYLTLSEDHIIEAWKAFSYWVRDTDIQIQLLLGGEKTVSGALKKAQELHAVMVAAGPQQNTHKTYRGNRSPLDRRKDAHRRCAGVVGNQVTSKIVAMDTHNRKEMESHKETN
jgi:hypothetical protein